MLRASATSAPLRTGASEHMHNNGPDASVPVQFAHECRKAPIPGTTITPQERAQRMESRVEHPYAAELKSAILAARDAGRLVNDLYDRSAAAVYEKSDGSPVTDADLAADRQIRETISTHFPTDAFLTEESTDDQARLTSRRCWIVDPIDGTAQFIARTGRFDVVIALVVDGRPILGVICHPPSGAILSAVAGHGAWIETEGQRQPALIPPVAATRPIRVAGSIWFGMPSLDPERNRVVAAIDGEPALVLPVGIRPIELLDPDRSFDAVIGPISTPDTTYGGEWDFAAPDIIIREAGGAMSDLRGQPHRYNKPQSRNGGGLIYSCDPETHAKVIAAATGGLSSDLSSRG